MDTERIFNLSPGTFSDPSFADQTVMKIEEQCIPFTVDHPGQAIQYHPDHWNQLPITDNLDTPWDFNIQLNSEGSSKTSWMFSIKLNKVFVKINTYLNVYVS